MLLGIDIGGTFTDAVLIDSGHIVATSKCRTTHDNIMQGLLSALDTVLKDIRAVDIDRITLSTTVITNTVIQKQEEPVDLYIIAGPGMNVSDTLPTKPILVSGYTNHRGIVVEPHGLVVSAASHRVAAVSGKFSVRNPSEEKALASEMMHNYKYISEGSKLSGTLNFPRRTVSAYFNSAVYVTFKNFKETVIQALRKRGLLAPVYILKADGGSLPIDTMIERPVETVFTGPAASILGLMALDNMGTKMTVALDIGGTTTDISLWREGRPLMRKHGVTIREYPSAVRGFSVQSVGIGGESAVSIHDGKVRVGPFRQGPSVALGGTIPTLGDALIVLGKANYGDEKAARAAIETLGHQLGFDEQTMAEKIVTKAVTVIENAIHSVVEEENKRPIYVVSDIVNPDRFIPEQLTVVGGTAQSLGRFISESMKLPLHIPPSAAVANAVGAAVSRSFVELTVHLDTKKKTLVVPELGIVENNVTMNTNDEVIKRAFFYLQQEAERLQLDENSPGEIVSVEDFPIIDDWHSMNRLITVKVQLQSGVCMHV
ncbi:hydantoinase/oxoprolinase [Veillonella montpellierensis DNF00314]|uniref:Hydantoinase/oxoprolinase n=1 Tax=Veillonella montpellierensis DNF00314 TaxID=1401067 RepID=A0A096AMG9_9FIRM|nr:hydantoinase/oxoprolinase family protein [Veillonella montpellierensis]KGF47856.1 hydantoinase/oxoprolinase [Veillonella montpellierensis DNF00314]